ncbi:MAG TPA: hypothetical protein VGC96_02130 [Candidatus Elarobacter sp.]|jgi:hypothetical protein
MLTVRRTVRTVLAAWTGLAAVKNLCDLGAAFGLAPAARRFGSKNFAAIEKMLAPLGVPREAAGGLLAGAALTEALIALAYARGRVETATALAVLLFGSFALLDEALVDYELDATHREILVFVLTGYLAIRD